MFDEIFVLESSWDGNDSLSNSSVMPMVLEFAKHRGVNAYYQVFTDLKSFAHWVEKYNKDSKGKSLLYIASHGSFGSLHALNGSIKRTSVINVIKKAKNIPYIHFGSCHFGNRETLQQLMSKAKHLKWAAGYKESVDWLESALFDLFIWSKITPNGRTVKHKKTHTIVDELMNVHLKSFAKEFEFRFYFRKGVDTYENLIED